MLTVLKMRPSPPRGGFTEANAGPSRTGEGEDYRCDRGNRADGAGNVHYYLGLDL